MAARPEKPEGPSESDLKIAYAVMGNPTKSLIVRHLWRHGPSRGTVIAQENGLSGATMSLAMQQLEAWNVVSASIPPEQRHGRPVIYTLDRARVKDLVTQWMSFVEGGPDEQTILT